MIDNSFLPETLVIFRPPGDRPSLGGLRKAIGGEFVGDRQFSPVLLREDIPEGEPVVKDPEHDIHPDTGLVLKTNHQLIMMIGDEALFPPNGFPNRGMFILFCTCYVKAVSQRLFLCQETERRRLNDWLPVPKNAIRDASVLRLLELYRERTIGRTDFRRRRTREEEQTDKSDIQRLFHDTKFKNSGAKVLNYTHIYKKYR